MRRRSPRPVRRPHEQMAQEVEGLPKESRSCVASTVWRVTVRLCDVHPTVWRTILVRPDTKLAMLHRYIQAAMGWQEHHLYSFGIDGKDYGIPSPDLGKKIYDARRYSLNRLFPTQPTLFTYVYDFGDWWRHDVVIEGAEGAEHRKQYPICVNGAEPCPPEDCGGPPGYWKLRAILRDERHSRHAELGGWARSQNYPRGFNTRWATWSLRDVQRGYR